MESPAFTVEEVAGIAEYHAPRTKSTDDDDSGDIREDRCIAANSVLHAQSSMNVTTEARENETATCLAFLSPKTKTSRSKARTRSAFSQSSMVAFYEKHAVEWASVFTTPVVVIPVSASS